jgi:hypothetical protein
MLTCDRCSTRIRDDARFCPTCGDPVTAADKLVGQSVQGTERVSLVCPSCDKQSLHEIPAHGVGEVTCPLCQKGFATRVVTIRAKRSAGNKKLNTRSFSVRTEDLNGREDLIEFQRPGTEDFELRSRDLAAFSYVGGRLYVVQNLTIGRTMRIASPFAVGCVAVAIAVILLMFLVGFCSTIGGSPKPRGSYAPTPSSEAAVLPVTGTGSSAAQSAETMYVHEPLNVRSTPDRKGALVRTLNRGALVRLGPKDANGWAPLYDMSGTREGYVYRASNAVQANPPAEPAQASPRRSAASSGYHRGPRGGCYTYTASGNKRYVDRSLCD